MNYRRWNFDKDLVFRTSILLPFFGVSIVPITNYISQDHDPSRSLSLVALSLAFTLLLARVVFQLNVVLEKLESSRIIVSELVGGTIVFIAFTVIWLAVAHGSVLPDLFLSSGFLIVSAVFCGLEWHSGKSLDAHLLRSIIIEESIGLGIIAWAFAASIATNAESREAFLTAVVGGSALRCYALFVIETFHGKPWNRKSL